MNQTVCHNCFRERADSTGSCPHCGYDPAGDQGKYPFALPHGSILAGRYITGRVLGQGGFGITYLALDRTLNMKVAIKEFMPDSMAARAGGSYHVTIYTSQREDNFRYGMDRFLEEARVLARFQGNPNIVGVRSYFEENGTAYFVMDYIEGESFKEYVKRQGGRVLWQDSVRILTPVMDALAAVHREGIIHRDVTPDNIVLTKDGGVKLLDFGAARYSLGEKSQSLDVVLKAGYAPKEQYIRRGKQGPYTDVYSLAACFYATITGYLPPESLERMDEDKLVPPGARGVELPSGFEDVILKGLAVQPADRYQTMEEFRTALNAVVWGEKAPGPAAAPLSGPTPDPAAALVSVPAADSVVDPAADKRGGIGKGRFLVGAVAALAIALVLSVGINIAQYTKNRETAETVNAQALEIGNLNAAVSDRENKISSLNTTIADQKDTITSQQNTIAELQDRSWYYGTICDELSYGSIGYAADNFKSSESVIVVGKNETGRKFTLNAHWNNGGTVYVDYSSNSATVSFDNDSWTTSTKMTVMPWEEGVTAVTFSNSVDSRTFKILIIVTS